MIFIFVFIKAVFFILHWGGALGLMWIDSETDPRYSASDTVLLHQSPGLQPLLLQLACLLITPLLFKLPKCHLPGSVDHSFIILGLRKN